MKKKVYLLMVLAFAVLCSGCTGATAGEPTGETNAKAQKATSTPTPTPKQEKKEEISSPLEDSESAEAFNALGADIEVPAGAQDARYYIVDDVIAEIQFTFNDAEYFYRASIEEDDLFKIDESAVDGNSLTFTVGKKDITIETLTGGGYLTQWEYTPVHYSLYTADDEVKEETVQSLVREMALETASTALDTI